MRNASPTHEPRLNRASRINLGSFYTPPKFVSLVGEWLCARGCVEHATIADLTCGEGAFFALHEKKPFQRCRFVGNDIDEQAVETASHRFPFAEYTKRNALVQVSRESFGFSTNEKIILVGNPPYNDTTSLVSKRLKNHLLDIDEDLRTRDLGLSSLRSYNKLQADFVAILHPLSYLIKKTNFSAARCFFNHYKMINHLIFSSSEFEGTSKISSFPVIVALYERCQSMDEGLTYEKIQKIRWQTLEGDSFALADFDDSTQGIAKYPHANRYEPELLFWTLRDMNALKRSRTFILDRMANAVDVNPLQLARYCYIDCFKAYAHVPYYLGNLNIPYNKALFPQIEKDVIALSKARHPEIFGPSPTPCPQVIARVKKYINLSLFANRYKTDEQFGK